MNDSKNNENEKIPSNTESERVKDSGTCPIRPLDPPINVLDLTPWGKLVRKLFGRK